MDDLGQLVLGILLASFAGAVVSAGVFRVRHWHDWPDRWQTARPAISVVMAMDLLHRWLAQDRELPRSRAQAILWEAPTLFIAGGAFVGGVALVTMAVVP